MYVSVVPLGVGDEDQDQANNIFLTVASSPKSGVQPANLWDISGFEVFATDKTDNGVVRVKGQETSIWGLKLDNKHYYHIVPSTLKRGVEGIALQKKLSDFHNDLLLGDFILRVFSSNPILMESINALPINSIKGEWRRVGDLDTTGGALKITHSDGHIRENPKWCQNPQYHLEIADPHGKDEMYLKICLRRTDKSSSRNSGGKSGGSEQKKQDATIGITITKAEVLEDPSKRVKSKQPKQNIMGEVIFSHFNLNFL